MRRYPVIITAVAAVLLSSSAFAQKGGAKKPPPPPSGGTTAPAPKTGGEEEPEVDKPKGGEEPEIEIEPEEAQGDLAADQASLSQSDAQVDQQLKTEGKLGEYRVSWQDIVVVIRKPFLKVSRWEMQPMLATTMNDNMIRHYGAGGQINYYLTDVLAVGLEGQYFSKQFREPFDLVARQARRLPTINKYNWEAAFNFHYVPVYGKFAVLDKHIITWETFFTAGVGVTESEVVPRDPRFGAFKNLLITPNVGASMRFFLFKWLTVNAGLRDYLFVDKYEPVDRSETMYADPDDAKNHADSAFINNVMFQLSVSFWLPPSFEYTTFR